MTIVLEPTRQIQLDGDANFRDLGGCKTTDGRSLKYGLLYRAGSFSKLTGGDLTLLEKLGLRTVIDLRSAGEVAMLGHDRHLTGARHIALPIDPGNVSGILMEALQKSDLSTITPDMMVQLYRGFVRGCTDQYGELVRIAADPARRPLVAHCTHGKDRTGMGAAILLSALGVPWDTVLADYMLSNHYLKDELEAQQEEMRKLLLKPGGTPLNDVDMAYIAPLFTVAPTYLNGARQEMVSEYGSVENYLREGLGLSDEMRARLQNDLLE